MGRVFELASRSRAKWASALIWLVAAIKTRGRRRGDHGDVVVSAPSGWLNGSDLALIAREQQTLGSCRASALSRSGLGPSIRPRACRTHNLTLD
jgi:hypothetical protein